MTGSESYSVVLVEPITLAVAGTIGPFDSMEAAIEHAREDKDCRTDYHWTITPNAIRPRAIKQCCRQNEDGELVDSDEHSDTDVTLGIISDDGSLQCMECGATL